MRTGRHSDIEVRELVDSMVLTGPGRRVAVAAQVFSSRDRRAPPPAGLSTNVHASVSLRVHAPDPAAMESCRVVCSREVGVPPTRAQESLPAGHRRAGSILAFQHRADGLAQRVARPKTQLPGRPRAVDHADVADEVELGTGNEFMPRRQAARHSGLARGCGMGTVVLPSSRRITDSGTSPGPVTLKMPRTPGRRAQAMASATSCSWMTWTMGSKPSSRGMTGSRR